MMDEVLKCLEDYKRYYRHCLHIWFLLAVNGCNAPVSSSRCKDLFCTSYNCRVFFGTDLEPRLLWSTAMVSCLEMGHVWGQPWSDRMQFSIRRSHLSWMFFPTHFAGDSKPWLPPHRWCAETLFQCEVWSGDWFPWKEHFKKFVPNPSFPHRLYIWICNQTFGAGQSILEPGLVSHAWCLWGPRKVKAKNDINPRGFCLGSIRKLYPSKSKRSFWKDK